MPERCNELDDDCDGQVDENLFGGPCTTGLDGVCAEGRSVCSRGDLSCEPIHEPTLENSCNLVDDDCDGLVDECFVAGTPIAMADGTQRQIERINVGDWVLAYDVEAGMITPAPVLRTFVHEQRMSSQSIIRINKDLRATANHPFYANGHWVPASKLDVFDELIVLDAAAHDGLPMTQAATVTSLYTELEKSTTYNLTVGTHHNYFAGGVLVHNKLACPEERMD
ncbi:Hint domain-containing protein [Sorangium sp. So ce362]|uniref:Hint domain-containing protein n=1 Tax=Sorangium sp. So ce362 TaxID=3133303 RepID=UPI003F5FD3C0